MIFFVLFLLLLMFSSVKIAEPNHFNQNYMSREDTSAIKGIFVILVLLGHAVTYVNTNGVFDEVYLELKSHLNQMVVAMFLFYSGFGMMKSILNKKFDYVRRIPGKRFLPVFINFAIAVMLFVLVNLLLGTTFSFSTILWSLIGWSSVGNSNWYMFVIFVLYLLMFVCFYLLRWFDKPVFFYICNTIFTVLVIGFVFWEIRMGLDTWWYNTAILLPLGCWYALLQKPIEAVLMKNDFLYTLIGSICLTVYAASFWQRWSGIEYYTVWAAAFTITIVILTMKFSFHSPVIMWFGDHIFSVYILQRIPMMILSKLGIAGKDRYMFMILVIIFTILLAIVFDFFTSKLNKKISKYVG